MGWAYTKENPEKAAERLRKKYTLKLKERTGIKTSPWIAAPLFPLS
jgi:hypothetical protein